MPSDKPCSPWTRACAPPVSSAAPPVTAAAPLAQLSAGGQAPGNGSLARQAYLQSGNQRIIGRPILPRLFHAGFESIEALEYLLTGRRAGGQPGRCRFHSRLNLGRAGFQSLRPLQKASRSLGHLGVAAHQAFRSLGQGLQSDLQRGRASFQGGCTLRKLRRPGVHLSRAFTELTCAALELAGFLLEALQAAGKAPRSLLN